MKDLEIWKIYQLNFDSSGLLVSNFGKIKRFDWEDRSISDNGAGYKKVAIHNLSKDKKFKMKNLYLHRIVAELFLPKPLEHQTQVNHIDGDKTNNCVTNLEWVTDGENLLHAYRVLGRKQKTGKNHHNSRAVLQLKDGKIINSFDSLNEATRATGAHHSGISMCCNGKIKKHKGYQWRYKEE